MKTPSNVRRDDFNREIVLDCEKDGTITFRNRADKLPEGSLPFFSVDTAAEAGALIVRLCKVQYDLHPRTRAEHYRFVDFGKEMTLDDMDRLADRFRNAWFDMKERAQLS